MFLIFFLSIAGIGFLRSYFHGVKIIVSVF